MDSKAVKKYMQAAVQDTMLNAGLLNAEYSVKVLTTYGDKSKLVLVINLKKHLPGGLEQMASAEKLIGLLSRARHGLEVAGVYWRVEPMIGAASHSVMGNSLPKAVRDTSAATLPLAARLPKFYDDEPGYKPDDFPPTRPADSDLMGLT